MSYKVFNTLYLTNNACYIAGDKITPTMLMLHSTGANNPYLSRYIGPNDGYLGENKYGNHWNQYKPDGRSVCTHGFIGKLANEQVAAYQTLPWTMRGWHCGGSANDYAIGIEICEDALSDDNYFSKVYWEAVNLFSSLCIQFDIEVERVICHSEGYKLGIASNHSDVEHWFGRFGTNMDNFRKDLKQRILDITEGPTITDPEDGDESTKLYKVQIGAYAVKSNAEKQLAIAKAMGFEDAFIQEN